LPRIAKIHGHCNIPRECSEKSKLANLVNAQRKQYKLQLDGKASHMTLCRIKKLEGLGFEWGSHIAAWEDRLSELSNYRKIHGHCNVSRKCSEKSKLATWVATQRTSYRLHLDGKASHMTDFRIQELESLGFEWGSHIAAWEDRLSELSDYRKIHGHWNVPRKCSEHTKLANWVNAQRKQYKLQLVDRKTSPMTDFRIQELESLGFE
jgi:hypothetical protein